MSRKQQDILIDTMMNPIQKQRDSHYGEITTIPVSDPSPNGQATVLVTDAVVAKIADKVIEKQQLDIKETVVQEQKKDKLATEEKITQIIDNPSRTLFGAKAVFPFEIFPDEILIEELRINIITRSFFASHQIQTISYKELRKVEVETNVFFGTIRFITLTAIENHIEVSFLKRTDALKARRIIEGLKILSDQKVDLSHIPTHELIEKVDNLGSVKQ